MEDCTEHIIRTAPGAGVNAPAPHHDNVRKVLRSTEGMQASGYIHSLESLSTVDGPGVRGVVFLQGCEFRCRYCHNPDSWAMRAGERMDTEAVMARIKGYAPYYRNGGGVTFSGGEPLLQAAFVRSLIRACHELGLHTALDTNGHFLHQGAKAVLGDVDLVILDVKHTDPHRHEALTAQPLAPTLDFLDYLTAQGIPFWVRQVIVPGWNDTPTDMEALAHLLGGRDALQRVDLLPLHHLGTDKWKRLGIAYPLGDTPPPSEEQMRALRESLWNAGVQPRRMA